MAGEMIFFMDAYEVAKWNGRARAALSRSFGRCTRPLWFIIARTNLRGAEFNFA
ncbi:MAG: hypothetical protein ABR577_15555 [Pyrinomonadaceae bacterium]